MQLPDELATVLSEVERLQKPVTAEWLANALLMACQALDEGVDPALKDAAFAEVAAWSLMVEASAQKPWRRYFGPNRSAVNSEGAILYTPDINRLGSDVLRHWSEQSVRFAHPVIKARYADLSWELCSIMTGSKADYEKASVAIDSYLKSVSERFTIDLQERIVQASRARNLARQIRDVDRADAATVLLIELHEHALAEGSFWWKTYDVLVGDKRLSEERREWLAGTLEVLAARYADETQPESFDPHKLEGVSRRLSAYYARAGKRYEALALYARLGRAFEHAAELGDGLVASAMLQTAENAYLDAQRRDDAKRVRLGRIEAIRRSQEEMVTFVHTMTIPKEKMDDFVNAVVSDSLPTTFLRMVCEFLPNVETVEKQVKEEAEGTFAAFIPISLIAREYEAAKIGGVEDDLEGRIVLHAAQNVQWQSAYLNRVLRTAVDRHSLSPQAIAGFADRSGLFEDITFLLEGIRGWLLDDHFKAIFVLTPQVEHALRNITAMVGEPTTRKHPTVPGREIAIGMGEILGSQAVKDALGDNIIFYFKYIYSDPRGLNLRNSVAHGLLDKGMVNSVVSDLLIHSLLLLGVWRELAEHWRLEAAVKLQA